MENNSFSLKRIIILVLIILIYASSSFLLFKVWTNNTRTFLWTKIALGIILLGGGIWSFFCVINKRIVVKALGLILAMLFIVTNGILSVNAYNLYAFKSGIPIGSAYLPPNADLPVFEELVENKIIILGQKEGHINQVCYLISNDCEVDENKADELYNHTFICLGLLRSMYELYAPLFGFEYENEVPVLYVEPYDPKTERLVVVEDSDRNVYIFSEG